MSSQWYEVVQRIFHEAGRLDKSARGTFLDEACADDRALRDEVESLLSSHATREFMNTPALGDGFRLDAVARDDQDAPETIGDYKIIRRLGHGGMGVVYEAKQSRTGSIVALKVIRPGAASREVVRRFEHEAQILGRLRHPGIARVHEAGIHRTGDQSIPFIAMELVEGPSLIDYVKRQSPDTPAILALFTLICDAVHHAHQKGVIHRDLKPSNILIDDSGSAAQPKILDFGIARITDADTIAATQHTRTGQLMGTVKYMSPEQAGGDPTDIDTRSDVYALGVILYELLTRRMPYAVDRKMIHEAVRVIREDDATPLSVVDRAFKGDLTTILGKALDKDKSRRYQSTSELAADIQRYLHNEPIAAHPQSTVYQLQKFARRNRGLVAGASVAFTLLVLGIITTTWQAAAASKARDEAQRARVAEKKQRLRAEQRFNEVRSLARTLIFDLDDRIKQLPGATPARELLVTEALDYLQSVAKDLDPNDVQLQAELSAAYFKLGSVQGDHRTASLGEPEAALNSYMLGLQYAQALAAAHPDDPEHQLADASARNKIGEHLASMNRADDARPYYDQALTTLETINQIQPNTGATMRELGQSYAIKAGKLAAAGDLDLAIETGRQSLAVLQDAVALDPAHIFTQHALASTNSQLAKFFERRGSLETALLHRQTCLAIIEEILATEPHSAVYQHDLGTASERVGYTLQQLGNHEQALPFFQRAAQSLEHLVALDATNDSAQYAQIVAWIRIGESQLALSRLPAATSAFQRHLELCQAYADTKPADAAAQRLVSVAFYKMADVARAHATDETLTIEQRVNRWDEAIRWLEQCEGAFRQMRERNLLAKSDAGVPNEIAAEVAACKATRTALTQEEQ